LQKINQLKIQKIICIHGTYVGNNPFQFKNINPTVSQIFKMIPELLLKDLGNFSDETIYDLQSFLGSKIPILNFTWSSANHHYARVKGLNDLILYLHHLTLETPTQPQGPILLLAHSHGGQILALLSQLKSKPAIIIKMLRLCEFDLSEKIIEKVTEWPFYYVTMGTPIRYEFSELESPYIVHIKHQRPLSQPMDAFNGWRQTQSGDYIQMWGTYGSDLLPTQKNLSKLCYDLDHYLGIGRDIFAWKKFVETIPRIHPVGQNILIDYDLGIDQQNFYKTFFGHGLYTKKIYLTKLLELALNKLTPTF
jgi:hypothetical protein